MNRQMAFFTIIAVSIFIIAINGCDTLDSAFNPPGPGDKIPTAVITLGNSTVRIGSLVTLGGESSSDPRDQVLTYFWAMLEKPTGSAATLTSTTDTVVTFVADKGGYYSITLIVTNESKILSSAKQVRISAVLTGTNHPPTANAGADQTAVKTGAVAILDASGSYDPDGDSLRYNWEFLSLPASSTAALTHAEEVDAYLYPDVAGDYYIKLRVSDGIDSDLDYVTITAQ